MKTYLTIEELNCALRLSRVASDHFDRGVLIEQPTTDSDDFQALVLNVKDYEFVSKDEEYLILPAHRDGYDALERLTCVVYEWILVNLNCIEVGDEPILQYHLSAPPRWYDNNRWGLYTLEDYDQIVVSVARVHDNYVDEEDDDRRRRRRIIIDLRVLDMRIN